MGAQAAEANCAASCEVEGKKGSFPCKDRVDYAVKRQRTKLADAIDTINEECKGQCNCTLKYYSQSSLLQEDVEDTSEQVEEVEESNDDQFEMEEESELSEQKIAILKKKLHLEEELEAIDKKLHPDRPTADELGAQSIWPEYMNNEALESDE